MIELIVFDIDGVLTDGSILVNTQGQEMKRVNIKDIDAVYEMKRQGYRIAAVTGEKTEIVQYFRSRFPWDYFMEGQKHKTEALSLLCGELGVSPEHTAYIGDGKYDLDVLRMAGLSVCPADAIPEARILCDVVLHRNGGSGCVWELLSILERFRQDSPLSFFQDCINEHQLTFKSMAADTELMQKTLEISDTAAERLNAGGQIFLCGNGGSAADAQHIAAEFIGRFFKERPALCAEALTVNTSILTAIGNDYGYERVFVRQVEGKAKKGDILIGLSTSGGSKNVRAALQYAKEHGIMTVMMTGQSYPADTEDICDYVLAVPSRSTPRIQEAHIFLGHMIAQYVEHKLFGGNP
ncbi:MAG: HAD-IIIA family hydrolase [Oscillospiraceae bacterium]|nr:HAD-IIIA family hydrolase [Oscillospiraceae bacterium]